MVMDDEDQQKKKEEARSSKWFTYFSRTILWQHI